METNVTSKVSGVSDGDLEEAENSAAERARQGTLELLDLLRMVDRLCAAGKKDAAKNLYGLWIDHNSSPLAYVVHFNLGVLLAADGDYVRAAQANQKALELNPDLLQARLNLGTYLEHLGQSDETLEQWRSALGHQSIGLAENRALHLHALNNLGRLLETKREFRESLRMLERSLLLDPDQVDVLLHLGHLRQKQCIWPLNMLHKGSTKEETVRGCSPLAMLSASDDPELQHAAASWFVEHKFSAETGMLAPPGGYRHGKIRVGYLSSDFCLHAVSLLTVQLFELHDREHFEVYGFCWSREDGSPLRNRVMSAMDHFIKIGGMDDQEAARCIRSHEIDVLIDLQGLTSGARPLILSHRPASVQMTYLGFPGTTGLPWIDHVIADRYLIPEESARHFSEKPLYLPNCFQASDSQRPVGPKSTRAANGLPEEAFVFCSFNNNYKFTEELFAVWMQILKRVSGSVLWLLGDNEWARKNLVRAAKRQGIKKDRLIFASRVAPPDYLARYHLADLFLDTFPFNGGTTANDALFMGLPLLTLSGRTFASRMAGSLLTNLGLPELIATSLKEYAEKAVRLAKRPAELASIKDKLADRQLSTIFDIPALTRDIENLYRQALIVPQAADAPRETAPDEAAGLLLQQQGPVGEEDVTPPSRATASLTLPKLTPMHATTVKNFHCNVNGGISDPEKFARLMAEAAQLVTPGYFLGDGVFTWGMNNSLFEDAAFVESWQKNTLNRAEQALAWRRYLLACSACNCLQLEGDFVECGVDQGSGIKTVIDYFGVANFERDFWGYDSFDRTPAGGPLSAGEAAESLEAVQERFSGYSRVKLVAGLLPAALEGNSPGKISYLHLALHAAETEIAVLDRLFDRVVAGGTIILDDYERSGIHRQQKMLQDSWFEARGYRVFPLPTGQGLVLKR